MTDVVSIVETLDLVVGLAHDHLHPDDLRDARGAATAARGRVGHLGSTLVLALLGGTGAGKSSVLNAIAGERIASTSAVRPHTDEPLAWVPAHAETSLRTLLDNLEVASRVPHDRFAGLAILDMTDVDSLVASHRARVEELLPSIDVAVWVFDPVKYADAVVHKEFIAPNAHAADRLIFILNQVDLIPPDDRAPMREHLVELLMADGIEDPVVFETAADPAEGPHVGIDELVDHLDHRLDEKRVHLGRIIEDIRSTARAVAGATGITKGGPLEFERRWDEFRTATIDRLVGGGPSIVAFEESLRSLDELILRLSVDAGGPFGTRIRQTFDPDRLDAELRGAVEITASLVPIETREGGRAEEAAQVLDAQLQARIGAPLREIVWDRASLSAVVAGLAVDATMAEADLLGVTPE
jgi:hypothetical protein